jgi:hypothetical protein
MLAIPAAALELQVIHANNETCDPLEVPDFVHELGLGALSEGPFPPDEEILVSEDLNVGFDACNPVVTVTNALVHITNKTGSDFSEVWYVADPDTDLTNYDGWVNDPNGAVPCELFGCKAFRIDSVGANKPLISESLTADGIFENDETWSFVIDDYLNTAALPPSALNSLLVGSKSPFGPSSGSIIAVLAPVPEPGALSLLALAVGALGWRLRRCPRE